MFSLPATSRKIPVQMFFMQKLTLLHKLRLSCDQLRAAKVLLYTPFPHEPRQSFAVTLSTGNDVVGTIGTSVRRSSGRRSGGRLLAMT